MNGLNKILLVLVIVVFILCGAMFVDLYLEDKLPAETNPSTETTETPETNALIETTEPDPVVTTEGTDTEPTTEPTTGDKVLNGALKALNDAVYAIFGAKGIVNIRDGIAA